MFVFEDTIKIISLKLSNNFRTFKCVFKHNIKLHYTLKYKKYI